MIKLLKYLRKGAVLCAIMAPIFMFLEVSMDLMQPKLMSDIIDVGVVNGDISYVLSVGGKMLFMAFLGIVGGAGCSIFAAISAMNFGQELRRAIFEKIQTLSFKEIDEFKTSSLITRVTNDVTQIQNMFFMALRVVIRSPLMAIGGIFMAMSLSVELSKIFLIILPIMIVVVLFIMKKSFALFLNVQKKVDNVNVVMRENILGIRVVKAFIMEGKQWNKFTKVNDELMDAHIEAQNIQIFLWPIVTLLLNFGVIAVLWFGGNLANAGGIEVGKIMAFVNYLIQIMNSLMMVIMIALNISRAKASADRINEVFASQSSIKEEKNTENIDGFDVEFRNVFFKYNEDGEDVLSDVSFTISEGEKVGIIGTTGSGKSSLISLIPRLYDVTNGEILFGGKDVRKLSIKDLRHYIGVVPQDNTLFSGTIEENFRFGKGDATEEELIKAAKNSESYEFIIEKEGDFQGLVEQRGKNFSGGQKQRLCIGRTLIRNPKILIMDDSTSALDMATEARLQENIKNEIKDSTFILVAQRITALMNLDKIIVLDDGKISGIGTHKELLKSNEIYRSIAVSQLGEEVLMNV